MLTLTTLSLVLAFASPHPDPQASISPVDDDALLARRATHDPDAFTTLYHRHLEGIYRYHMAHTGHVQEAQDLTAQTFLTALERISTFRATGSFSAWLYGIASHKLVDHYRRNRDEFPLEVAEGLRSPSALPEETILRRLELERVAAVLRLISPERAQALTMCIYGGLSLRETAQVVGKSESAVKMLVYRGLSDLQERLSLNLEVAP